MGGGAGVGALQAGMWQEAMTEPFLNSKKRKSGMAVPLFPD
jgi:hypothetical protein